MMCVDGTCAPARELRARVPDGGLAFADATPVVSNPEGQVTGDRETCGNGLDDDGNGEIDDTCPCGGGMQSCYAFDPAKAGVGDCARGMQACDTTAEFGAWGACTGSVAPGMEACDGRDNDCDGTIDNGCLCTAGSTRPCYAGPAGTAGVGACREGMQACVVEGGTAVLGACEGSTVPADDVCGDGIDSDCDGMVDEGCACTVGEARDCFEDASGTRGPGMPGVGICRNGTQACEARPGGGSAFGACSGAVFASATEECDGVDSNCDGVTDEGCTRPVGTDQCITLPAGVSREVSLSYMVRITVADVLFLVDTTGSMGGEIFQIQSRLTGSIIPGLAAAIPDVNVAVAKFEDFPAGGYGVFGNRPFTLFQPSTSNTGAAQLAVGLLSTFNGSGADEPESAVEALFQAATGAGIGSFVPAQTGCPAGTIGYPCFRRDATPIIVLVSDATFHNGPLGSQGYWGVFPSPHSYDEAVAALRGIGAKVLSLYSGGFEPGRSPANMQQVARDTGAVRPDGSPIVFDIGSDGSRLDSSVIGAVQSLVNEVPIDVDLFIEDLGGGAMGFVRTITAVSATPAGGATNRGDRFENVRPGTTVVFNVTFRNDMPAAAASREYVVNIVMRGDGATRLAETSVRIIVPGTSGSLGCPG